MSEEETKNKKDSSGAGERTLPGWMSREDGKSRTTADEEKKKPDVTGYRYVMSPKEVEITARQVLLEATKSSNSKNNNNAGRR